ncbi:MAG TPA: cytochrome P450 [Blastocatellia bacterium]
MLFDANFLDNPYPSYQEMRDCGPIHQLEMLGGAWAFPRHAEVASLLMCQSLSARRSDVLVDQFAEDVREELSEFKRLFSMWMLFFDPPEHTRARKAMLRGFVPEALNGIRAKIQVIVNELIDAVEPGGRMDVIADFAHPLPALVIAEFLGVPVEDRDRFIRWSDDIAEFFGSSAATPGMARKAQRSLVELMGYFRQVIPRRRTVPGDDLLSVLIHLKDQDETLTEEELYAQCAMLLFAGHETTRNLIGNGLLALLNHPKQLKLLAQNPSLAGTAVDEFLRYDSPVQFGTRLAKDDMELHGRKIAKGQLVILLLGSANRDQAEFRCPDLLDITRKPNRHVSFGYGPHMCMGASLAHIEGEIAFNTLLRRMPAMRLETTRPEWSDNFGFRGLKSLGISF